MLCLHSKASPFTQEEHGFPSVDSEQNNWYEIFLASSLHKVCLSEGKEIKNMTGC